MTMSLPLPPPSPPATLALPTPLTLVVNAQASGAPRGAALETLRRMLGPDTAVEVTATLAELEAVWRRDDGRRLVLVGGDGSIHAVANLGGPPRDVALIPAGAANNVARCAGIPLARAAAARLAATGAVRPVDLIEARTADRRLVVVESVSAGFLAQARVRYRGANSADVLAGLRAGAAALAAFRPLCAHIGDEDVRVAQLFVANLPLYEFGLRVAPHADPTDATLDLIAVEARSRAAVLRMLVRLRRGTHLDHPGVRLWRARRITLATHGCSPIVGDSTDLGSGPVTLTALPAALRLVRP